MVSEAHSPFALRYSILRASNEDEFVAAAGKLSKLFSHCTAPSSRQATSGACSPGSSNRSPRG